MRISKALGALAVTALLFAACSGGPGATQQPGAGTQDPGNGGGTATDVPAATQGGGGGGGATGANGKVSFQLGAPFNKSGELDFIPLASHFAGDQGSSLTFSTADNNEIVVLLFTQGVMSASWGTSAGDTMAGAQCTTQDLKIEAGSASGSFDCAHGVAISGGAQTMDTSFKGSFTAHN
jgi:hypothetical protein